MAKIIANIFQTKTERYTRTFEWVISPRGIYHKSELQILQEGKNEAALTIDGFVIFARDCQWAATWQKVA